MLTLKEALRGVELLLGAAIALQSLEYWKLRKTLFSGKGWSWLHLRRDWDSFPPAFRRLADEVLADSRFTFLPPAVFVIAGLQLSAAALSLETGWEVPFLFLFTNLFLLAATLLTAARFRGAFNGGSDTATVHFLIGCVLSEAGIFFDETGVKLGLAWITVQITLSYFVAGLAKARSRRWWNGEALKEFVSSPRYATPAPLQAFLARPLVAQASSLGVLLFELCFPIVHRVPTALPVALAIGACFHLANFFVFGLNRFFFAWIAGYPALWYWVSRVPGSAGSD
jgi:hypothetical protein